MVRASIFCEKKRRIVTSVAAGGALCESAGTAPKVSATKSAQKARRVLLTGRSIEAGSVGRVPLRPRHFPG